MQAPGMSRTPEKAPVPEKATLLHRARAVWPVVVALYAPAVFVLAVIVALRIVAGIPMANVTRDPAQILEYGPFIGALSKLGVLLWAFAAAVCLFAAALAQRRGGNAGEWPVGFLRLAGVLTAVLMLDDFYMLHEVVLPAYLGIPELVLYVAYAAALTAMLVRYGRHIPGTEYPLLIIALGFFAASLLVDAISDLVLLPGTFLLEDGSKFLGIVGWSAFLIRTSAGVLRERMKEA